jgi:Fe-S-cluster-containing hydrogenase component 2
MYIALIQRKARTTMAETEIYQKLADHLGRLGMGYPTREDLINILKENLTPQEAEIALAVPTEVIPMTLASARTISANIDLPLSELTDILDRLVAKGMLFSGKTETGETGYALLQVGFGFPQTFFWKGEDTPHSRKMAQMVAKYFNRSVTAEAYGSETKPFRYIPVGKSLKSDLQAVYPYHMMEKVIEKARNVAVAHCPCRMSYRLAGRGCEHPTEVCMKFDELADFVIERGLARPITKSEALDIIRITEEAGLVHFVDNSQGEIKHNCNCCGCGCWSVGSIRRRKIPRDLLMATYFMRRTDNDACQGCGACAEICPVQAVETVDDAPRVNEEWCIGCGVCATVCPADAIVMELREDKAGQLPPTVFKKLHQQILAEKKAKTADDAS